VREKKLFHLQALRGLAASLVVLAHSIQGEYADKIWISGYFGVATFFILSGFIIYRTSSESFGSIRDCYRFIVKRLIRIFPIYWIATIVFIALSPHRAAYSTLDIINSLLLIPHYMALTDGMNPLLGQGWTLHYEVVFYAIFAFGLLFPRRLGMAVIIVALVVLVICGAFIRPDNDSHGALTLAQYWSRPIILLFVVGIGLGVLAERTAGEIVVPFPFLLMLGILAVWFAYSILSPEDEGEHMHFPSLLLIWGLCFLCVFIGIFGRSEAGKFETIAEAFGDASYSVYLFHPFILSSLIRLRVPQTYPMLYVIASLVGANVFGYVVYVMIEKPMLRQGRRMLDALS
jgi:exopolysaccharide production protein ExoZ